MERANGSPIMSIQIAREHDRTIWLFSWEAPKLCDALNEICARICRKLGPIRAQDMLQIRERVAARIYGGNKFGHMEKAIDYHFHQSGCFVKPETIPPQRLWTSTGRASWIDRRVLVSVVPAKTKPCRWCGDRIEYKESWLKWGGLVHCKKPDCRRMEYLKNIPQSRGGIDLTPRQRDLLKGPAQDTQRALNYLQLIAKEVKRNGRKSIDDVR